MKRPINDLWIEHIKQYCDICDRIIALENAFVQYEDVLSHNDLLIDASSIYTVDKKFGCIRLILYRYVDDLDRMVPEKMYALTPLDRIRGRVNVVRTGELKNLL